MLRIACLFLFAGVALGGVYHKPKTTKCFQCEYRPPKTTYEKVPRKEEFEVQVPKHTQECSEHKVLAGHRFVEKEHKDDQRYKRGVDYHAPHYGAYPSYGYKLKPVYGHYEPEYKTVKKCYPKVEYVKEKRFRTVYDTKTKTGQAGGFEPCMGPITEQSAKDDGVDAWDCHSSCYTRVDHHGNVARGCFKGEFGVNPHHPGPQYINGQTYRFCYGSFCNGDKVTH